MASDRLLTVAEACERLHLSRPVIYELFRSGDLASLKVGKSRRIPESSLEAFITERVAATGGGDAA